MKKFILILFCLPALAAPDKARKTSSITTKKSSTIPDKREFPLSTTVNPCENFHEYVCGEVENSFELRADRSRHTFAFDDSHERLLEKKKEFFRNIDQEKNLSPRAQQFVDYYKACMNNKARAVEERSEVQKVLKELKEIQSISDLIKYDKKNMLSGRPSLVDVYNTNNVDNSDVLDFGVATGFMRLPDHSYYEKKELVADYLSLMREFFKIVYPTLPKEKIAARVDKMFAFEKDFVKIYPLPNVRRQRWSEKRASSQGKFLTDYSTLQYEDIFSKIPKDTLVHVLIPEAMSFFNTRATNDNLDVLKDIYVYSALSGIMDDAYPQFFDKKFAFNKKHLGGADRRPVRQERCTMATMGAFEKELDEVMMLRLFPHFPEEKMQAVAASIRKSILSGVEKNTWLSKEAKAMAYKKMSTARLQIIKPQNEREWDFNPLLKYSPTEPIKNSQRLGEALLIKTFNELKEPANRDRWAMGPLTVNAYYSPPDNKFVMPMGILQFPFFNPEGNLVENLGAVGAVVGHELGHGIDDQGSKYDDKGRVNQWMTLTDLKEFSQRGSRLIEQFNSIGHRGDFTLGENIGDLVGVTFAYNAAFPNNQGSIEDKKKFFVSYARLWCTVARPGVIERQLKSDPHALGWARINEQVKHQAGFAEAFSCQAGDKMVLKPEERVQIW